MQSDGSLLVTETVEFAFVGGPFTYVFRKLPTNHTDGVKEIAASLDGATLPLGTSAGQVEIGKGNPIRVTWHFAPVSDATHRFGLTYHASGVVRKENGGDLLYWGALPDEYDYPIKTSTIHVTWPANAEPLGSPSFKAGSARFDQGAPSVTFSTGNLQPNSPLVIALSFKEGSLIGSPPQWQQREVRTAEMAPIFVAVSSVILIAGLIPLLFVWLRFRRDTSAVAPSGFRTAGPPSQMPPAVAGALNGDGPAWSNALATLFDLAQRGVLSIDETPGRGWFRQRDFVVARLLVPEGLKPHERGLLALLFETGKRERSGVKLSEVSQRLGSQWKKFAEPLNQEMEGAGFYSRARQNAKRQLNISATVLMGLSVAIFTATLLLAGSLGGWVVLISFAVFGISIAGYIAAHGISSLSDYGAQEAARWQSFYVYLREIVRGREAVTRPDLFERYLPYAASYGLAEAWAKFFQKRGSAKIPDWFHVLARASAAENMGAFVAMTSATSSAGANGAAGAAGAGAAGGGVSGAG